MSINDQAATLFEPGVNAPSEPAAGDLWMIFCGNTLMVKNNDGDAVIPSTSDTAAYAGRLGHVLYLGRLNGHGCYAAEVEESDTPAGQLEPVDLRSLIGKFGEEHFALCSRALHLLTWDRTHAFCGRCGTATKPRSDERARECPQCGQLLYPRISPAIIVAVVNGPRILLARKDPSPTARHSVLAGYVEPGESLEACLQREVFEEVGVRVRNIRYFGSQPWPFPDALMVAFTAEYAGGEIRPDGVEISHADWFGVNELPDIPRPGSISRRLIDWFVAASGQ